MHLNAYQIADAFPDEARELIPRFLTVLKALEWDIYEKEKMIMNMPCTAAEKDLYILFARSTFEQGISKKIHLFEKVMSLVNGGFNKDLSFNLAVKKAKEIDIESLYQFQRKHVTDNRIKASCPFHGEDKNPSFVIYRDNNTFHCFTCKISGDSIDFYMLNNKVTFTDALKGLSQ